MFELKELKLRMFLTGCIVAMGTYCAKKLTPICSPMIGQLFGTRIVASTDIEYAFVIDCVDFLVDDGFIKFS